MILRSKCQLDDLEIRGVREQANRNAGSEVKRLRRRFLAQFGRLATLSLEKLQLSRYWSRWSSAFAAARLASTQTSLGIRLGERKIRERGFHMMRTALLRRVEDKFGETERDVSQISTSDKLRELVDELRRSESRNSSLESQIQVKNAQLNDLQMDLRAVITEGHEAAKRLKEIQASTSELQRSFALTEQQYQDEIAQLRARLSLESSEQSEQLSRMEEALKRQSAERKAAYAFADDAQLSAVKEVEEQEEKLRSAEKVVKSLEELLVSSQERNSQLEKARQSLYEELTSLKMQKRQLESTISTNSIMGSDRENKMRKMLQEAKAQLEASNVRIDGQSEQIKSKQREIQLLEEEIEVEKRQIRNVQSKFLRNVSPRSRKTFDSD